MGNQYTKKKEQERKEIFWNIVNCGLMGAGTFLGAIMQALISKDLTLKSFGIAAMVGIIGGGIVAVTKFRDYWSTEEKEYTSKIFNFVR